MLSKPLMGLIEVEEASGEVRQVLLKGLVVLVQVRHQFSLQHRNHLLHIVLVDFLFSHFLLLRSWGGLLSRLHLQNTRMGGVDEVRRSQGLEHWLLREVKGISALLGEGGGLSRVSHLVGEGSQEVVDDWSFEGSVFALLFRFSLLLQGLDLSMHLEQIVLSLVSVKYRHRGCLHI